MSLSSATIAIIIYLFASSNLASSLRCYVCTHINGTKYQKNSPSCKNPTPNTVSIQRNAHNERTLLNALAPQETGRASKRLVCVALLGWFDDPWAYEVNRFNKGVKRYKINGPVEFPNGCDRTNRNVTDPDAHFVGYVCYCDTDLCNGQKSSLTLTGRLWTIGLLTTWLTM